MGMEQDAEQQVHDAHKPRLAIAKKAVKPQMSKLAKIIKTHDAHATLDKLAVMPHAPRHMPQVHDATHPFHLHGTTNFGDLVKQTMAARKSPSKIEQAAAKSFGASIVEKHTISVKSRGKSLKLKAKAVGHGTRKNAKIVQLANGGSDGASRYESADK